MLKITVFILFILVLISLSSALKFLLTEMGNSESKHTLYALGLRVGLAGILMGIIFYGVYTGELNSQAPWDYTHKLSAQDVHTNK